MSLVFNNINDNMDKRKFKTYVTGKYEPTMPNYFIENNVPPFYEDVDNDAVSYSSVSTIVDMCYHETDFSIPDFHDQETILEILGEYIKQAKLINAPPTRLTDYIKKCESAYQKIEEVHLDHLEFLHKKFPEKYQSPLSLFSYLKSRSSL